MRIIFTRPIKYYGNNISVNMRASQSANAFEREMRNTHLQKQI